MGAYLNPMPVDFQKSLNSEIYVDKSELIRETNKNINTVRQFMCVSRPRRFGKSMAMNMLAAYYCCEHDTHALFDGLKISTDNSYEENINKYHVIKVVIQPFVSMTKSVDEMLELLESELLEELREEFSTTKTKLILAMTDVYRKTGKQFIVLIDEWDCLLREYREDFDSQRKYPDFLRAWLKDQSYVALAYMTGILPVKKYGTHSALNMFSEYSMTSPGPLAPFFGFTEQEAKNLYTEHGMSFEEAKAWYDGYELVDKPALPARKVYSMYSPRSVVESIINGGFEPYWNQTETYEALKVYINSNMEGVKDSVVSMLGGESVPINIGTFSNDMATFSVKDDIFTLLVHLGYLSYHQNTATVSIPNREVTQEYYNSISTMDWKEVFRALKESQQLLVSLWNMNEDTVAQGIQKAHDEISILKYNDENSLCCCIQLAFYFAREYYTVIRELPTGSGYADLVFIPRKLHSDKPAAVIELKFNNSTESAIEQIKSKHYYKALDEYKGNLLLCGINYDKDEKKHECRIEKMVWGKIDRRRS